jgi:hypothetical protein
MVGDAKDIEPQLQKAGWRYEKVAFTDPISKEAPAPQQAQTSAPPASPKAIAAAKQLLADALAAKGGKAKLAALKGVRMTASGTTQIQGQKLPVEIERVFVPPDKMLIDATLAGQFKVTVGVDGKTGWQRAPTQQAGGQVGSQIVEFKGKEIDQALFEAWREPELLLLKATDPAAKITPAADDTVDGKSQAVVTVASPYGPDVTLYFDKKTKLLTRLTFTDGGVKQTEEFGDYKDVSGIKVAYKRKSTGQGRVTELEMTKIEWNPTVDPKLFAKPDK